MGKHISINRINVKKKKLRSVETAQRINYLLHKCKDLSSNPEDPQEAESVNSESLLCQDGRQLGILGSGRPDNTCSVK